MSDVIGLYHEREQRSARDARDKEHVSRQETRVPGPDVEPRKGSENVNSDAGTSRTHIFSTRNFKYTAKAYLVLFKPQTLTNSTVLNISI